MNKEQPVREGDEVELTCMSIGKKGDGIFKCEGFVVIAPDTIEGRTYKLRITKVMDNLSFANVIIE